MMDRIKSSVVAGMFYPNTRKELLENIKKLESSSKKDYEVFTRAIIVPHAGYFYSGQLAFNGFQYLDKTVKNIFIIAPSHHVAIDKPVLLDFEHWQTPLGEISINQQINKQLIKEFGCYYLNEAYEKEHSIEVQLPFIQYLYDDVKIIPILFNHNASSCLLSILEHFYCDEKNAFVVSSDLSHFHSDEVAQKIDETTANMIETIGTNGAVSQQACGLAGIMALHDFVQKKEFSLIRIGLTNSSSVSGDKSRVVGYGAWLLYEGEKTKFIEKYFSNLVLDICRKSIKANFEKKEVVIEREIPPVFNELGAAFVTLQKNNRLRGCIGSIVAHQPLIIDIAQHAYDAAFNDNRFSPLEMEEFDEINISVSLLSTPTQIFFSDENDLLNKLVPFVDGLIIKDLNHQAVYLPSVWEQLPNKKEFLYNLKVKAGLAPDHFSKTFEAFRFRTIYIKEKNI